MKVRKKPIEVDAVQWTGQNWREMFEFLMGGGSNDYMTNFGKNFEIDHRKVVGGLIIKTPEGDMIAEVNDWIIKGIKGEYYPIKPGIFDLTYDIVEE